MIKFCCFSQNGTRNLVVHHTGVHVLYSRKSNVIFVMSRVHYVLFGKLNLSICAYVCVSTELVDKTCW